MPIDLEKLRGWVGKDKRTQAEIALAAGMTPPHLSRLLAGKHLDVAISRLDGLAAAFSKKAKELLL